MHVFLHAYNLIHTHIHASLMYVCIYLCIYACTYIDLHECVYVSHRGVFRTTKSLIHALGTCCPMTKPTTNSTLLTFIEQVNSYDLQKMVLQFAICFVPTLGYTYMVYTLRISAQFHYQIDVYPVKSCCVVYNGT